MAISGSRINTGLADTVYKLSNAKSTNVRMSWYVLFTTCPAIAAATSRRRCLSHGLADDMKMWPNAAKFTIWCADCKNYENLIVSYCTNSFNHMQREVIHGLCLLVVTSRLLLFFPTYWCHAFFTVFCHPVSYILQTHVLHMSRAII